MNKDKIVSLSSRLNEIVDEANRHPDGNPGRITWSKAVYAIEALSKEANSRPVMPKCFDNWYQMKVGEDESTYSAIESLNREVTIHKIGYATILGTWISNDIDSRYQRCVEAILYGYEVSDNE